MTDILKVNSFARLEVDEDGVQVLEQVYKPSEDDYTLHASERVVLATNMGSPSQIDLGDLGATNNGVRFFLKTHREIKVGVTATDLWTVTDMVMFVGTYTAIWVQNEDLSAEATIRYLATD